MKLEAWAIFIFISAVYSFPQVTDTNSLVISTTEVSTENVVTHEPEQKKPILPKIYEMKVQTNVSNRFAQTLLTSKVKNLDKAAQEATFSVVIPDEAYISGFIMEIDGKSYEAYVEEKEQAKNTYDRAVGAGQAAGHVAVSARDSNRFTVSVNIEPQSKAVFYLKYEELLPRQNNQYEVVLNIHPGQPVKILDVEVHIYETRSLKFVKALSLRSGNEISKNDEKLDPEADISITNKTSALVKFSPDVNKQKKFANILGTNEENGLAAQFVVQYDVESDPNGGEVLVDGGYFVHFFSPDDLPALPKQVVFILDTSGSMQGIRITQLKEAMRSILSELKKDDVFNIAEFGTIVKVWNIEHVEIQYESGDDYWAQEDPEAVFKNKTQQSLPPAVPVTDETIKKAEQVVGKLSAFGGTDIKSALETALKLVQNNVDTDNKHQPVIIFLTDGEATVGETNNDEIIKTITKLNIGSTPVFSLSFGDGADRKFLEKLSLKNSGFARHIYEAADASLQLEEFYKQISSPLLSNVTFKYVSNVSEVTKTVFPILFDGSELVVSGQIDPGFAPPAVEGWGINGPVKLVPVVENSVGSLERVWAWLTLKQILQQRDAAENKTGPTQEALRIALKYSFVSDVSSLVVVKPNATSAVETEDASNDGRYPIIAGGKKISRNKKGTADINHNFSGWALASGKPSYFSLSGGGFGSIPSTAGYPAYAFQNAPYPESLDAEKLELATSPPLEESTEEEVAEFATTPFEIDIPSTQQSELDELDFIKSKLPWFSSILNENGTIDISSGNYELGLNETIENQPECPRSPVDAVGYCTLIHKCPQILTQITDVHVYEKYFCELKGYAGICCPKPQEKIN